MQKAETRLDFLDNSVSDQALRLRQFQRFEKTQTVLYREFADFPNVLAAHAHKERFLFQTLAAARRAGQYLHVLFDFVLDVVALAVTVTAQKVGNQSPPTRLIASAEIVVAVVHLYLLAAVAVQQDFDRFGGQILDGYVHREIVAFGERGEVHFGHLAVVHVPTRNRHRPLRKREIGVFDDEIFVDFTTESETRTHRTRAVRIVETEETGFDFFHGRAALRAGVFVRKQFVLPVRVHDYKPVRKF